MKNKIIGIIDTLKQREGAMNMMKKIVGITIVIVFTITFMPLIDGNAFAAAKEPAVPKITSATVSKNTVTIKWSKARDAKTYQVGFQSAKKKWVKIKTVTKSSKNKKKYTVKNKYKVKASGKKYLVYQYKFTYTIDRKSVV